MPDTYCEVGWQLYDAWDQLDDDQAADEDVQKAWDALREHCESCEQCHQFSGSRNEPVLGEEVK